MFYRMHEVFLYPALMGSILPPQNSAKVRKLDGRLTARKSSIGLANHQWGMKKTPNDGVSLYG